MQNITKSSTSWAGGLDAEEKSLKRYIQELHNKYVQEYQDLESRHADLLMGRTDRHYTMSKGFIRGLLSSFSFYPHTKFTPAKFYIDSDFIAILHDWAVIGSDLEAAILKYSNMCSTSVKQPANFAATELTEDWSTVR